MIINSLKKLRIEPSALFQFSLSNLSKKKESSKIFKASSRIEVES